ncbi:MAG: anthranilate synthase component I family protein [Candidatus Dormibacteria bacterium]
MRTRPLGAITGPHLLAAMGESEGAFVFESATGDGEFARHTIAGIAHSATTIGDASRRDPFAALEQAVATDRSLAPLPDGLHLPFIGGGVAVFAYESVRALERIPRPRDDPLGLPDAWIGVTDTVAVIDREEKLLHLVTTLDVLNNRHEDAIAALDTLESRIGSVHPGPEPEIPATATDVLTEDMANVERDRFLEGVQRSLEHIALGDVFQVQLSRRFSLPLVGTGVDLYRALRQTNPSPYMFFVRTPRGEVVGSSPEMLVRVEEGRIDYHPIAGTRRRGRTSHEDACLEDELRGSEKEQAEHLMLVDLGRNDVGRVSEIGSVIVTELAAVRRYAAVMHLESSITGRLRHDLRPIDALRAAFPAGTVTGAPKVRAMEIIADTETQVRGAYAGAVGYLDVRGNLDTAIALRTALVQRGTVHLQAAAGIVADSDPEEEAREIDNKLRALAHAVAAVNR